MGLALISSILIINMSVNTNTNPEAATSLSLTPHALISIVFDFQFNAANGVVSGSGIAADPYVIAGWDINTSGAPVDTVAGIFIEYTHQYFIIRNCRIHDGGLNPSGIYLSNCQNSMLINNTCSKNAYGIVIRDSSNIALINNSCMDNAYDGMHVISTNGNTINNNTCSNNHYGLFLGSLSDNTLHNNSMIGGGIVLDGSVLSQWNTHSIDSSNMVNGKPIYYYKDQSGFTVPAGAGQVILANCTDIIIEDQNLSDSSLGIELGFSSGINITENNCSSNNDTGIYLYSSSNNTLINNTCSNSDYGLFLTSSSRNTLINNTCSNSNYGIYLYSSSNNILRNNTCSNNAYDGMHLYLSNGSEISNNNCSESYYGLYLDSSSNNILRNNTCNSNIVIGIGLVSSSNNNALINNSCSNNQYGAYLYSASGNALTCNLICHNSGWGIYVVYLSTSNSVWNNTFTGNNGAGISYNSSRIQAYDSNIYGTANFWNSSTGYGNFWGDWESPDNDMNGIVDFPYNISWTVGLDGPKDYYPLAPLITKASLSGAIGMNEWYRSNVAVTLLTNNYVYGINSTRYRVGTSGNWSNYSSSFTISGEGNHTIQFYSRDTVGNNETIRNITIKIDWTTPTLTINQTAGFNATTTYVAISWNGSDRTSGIDHFEVSIDGSAFVSVGMAMSHNFTGLADGTHNVAVRVIDAAGNMVNQTIQFTVQASGLGDLMLYGAIIAIIMMIILAMTFIMRKKKSPPMQHDETKA